MGREVLTLSPEKRYFKIGEVARLADVKPYVLRFWESEFKEIKPKRSLSGQRVYSRQDVELILTIKRLLYEEKFTIPGARAHLKGEKEAPAEQAPARETPAQPPPPGDRLSRIEIRRELMAIRDILK